jgi:hypothetical protein
MWEVSAMQELLVTSLRGRLSRTLVTITLAGFATGWMIGGRQPAEPQLSAAGANWVR